VGVTGGAWATRHRALLGFLTAGAAYLVVSVALWWHVWSSHPTSTAVCGCGDPALFLWFLEWPAYALAHGHSLFSSSALFHPSGIDLLANTSVLAIGVPLAPVTWVFGPVATLNVASTLTPVLSALAAFWLLGRWVRWAPAAFVGGLLYGFSPFVLANLADAHLMTAALAVPPLILGCLDELFVRQRRRPVAVGVVLGLLVVVEFFVSTEMLVVVGMASVIGTVFLVAFRWASDRHDLAERAGRAAPGIVAAGAVSIVLLAYPAWFALAGPAHLAGRLWPNIPVIGGYVPRAFVDAATGTRPSILLEIGGYLGRPLPSSGYVGWGLLAVVAGGALVWRRDRRLWFFGALALATAVLSLGERKGHWVPWQLFDRVPVLDNVIEQRFVAVTYLALAAMLAVVLDRVRHLRLPEVTWGGRWTAGARRAVPLVAVAGVLAVGLGPIVGALATRLPYAVRPVDVPAWFIEQAPSLPPGDVLLAYPPPFSGIQSSMAWQAIDGMHFAQAGGGGPEGTPERAGRERPGFLVLADLGFGFAAPPAGTAAELGAVRAALRGWEVSTVVIPDQRGLPTVLRGHDPRYAAGFMTAVIGRAPTFRDGAWVWTGGLLAAPPLHVGPATLAACTALAERRHLAPAAVPSCVVAAAARAVQAAPR